MYIHTRTCVLIGMNKLFFKKLCIVFLCKPTVRKDAVQQCHGTRHMRACIGQHWILIQKLKLLLEKDTFFSVAETHTAFFAATCLLFNARLLLLGAEAEIFAMALACCSSLFLSSFLSSSICFSYSCSSLMSSFL